MEINYEMVDLGLPSGLKWAKCNLGAMTETDYGLYFQWGSTKGYTLEEFENGVIKFIKEDMLYYDENIVNKYTKYNPFLDEKVTLDKYDDAVSKHMGLSYRIPTDKDFYELMKCTNSKWISNYKGSGINGRLFISKINDNTLFIPASGFIGNGSFYQFEQLSCIYTSNIEITFNPPSVGIMVSNASYSILTHGSRYFGRPLRAVSNN